MVLTILLDPLVADFDNEMAWEWLSEERNVRLAKVIG